MSDLSAYGSSIQGLKEQAQSCRVGPDPERVLSGVWSKLKWLFFYPTATSGTNGR